MLAKTILTYSSHLPERVPLSKNEDFKAVRNAVVKAAVGLIELERGGHDPQEEDTPLSPVDELSELGPSSSGQGRGKKKSWWTDGYMQARRYLYGTGDTPCDLEKAAALLTAEARKGNGFAMYDLGKIQLDKEQPDTAQEWFRKAHGAFLAEESTAKKPGYLRYRIGKLYALGHGVEQDFSAAARWYEKAAKLGNANAEYRLGKLFLYGEGMAQDQARAIAYLTSAAEHGNVYAAQLLQRFYEHNNGTVAACALSLLQQTARIFQDRLQEYYAPQVGHTDRKLLSKIAEKKLAQGQKLGG